VAIDSDPLQILSIVIVIFKDDLLIVTTLWDVMGETDHYCTCYSRHGRNDRGTTSNESKNGRCPLLFSAMGNHVEIRKKFITRHAMEEGTFKF